MPNIILRIYYDNGGCLTKTEREDRIVDVWFTKDRPLEAFEDLRDHLGNFRKNEKEENTKERKNEINKRRKQGGGSFVALEFASNIYAMPVTMGTISVAWQPPCSRPVPPPLASPSPSPVAFSLSLSQL